MTVAADTRAAVREHPFLVHALRAGLVNHAAAAAFLDVEGESEAVATALRRYAEELPPLEVAARTAQVTMRSGVTVGDDVDDPLLSVGDAAVGPRGDGGGESLTAVLATGEVDPAALGQVCSRLDVEGVEAHAVGAAEGSMVVVVDRRGGATAVRLVEQVLASERR